MGCLRKSSLILCFVHTFAKEVQVKRVKLASCKSALNPTVVYSNDRSKAVVPVLVLLFVSLWFILGGDFFYVLPCVILFFSPFSIAITSLGEERANLIAFRTFVRFVLVWICRFSLPVDVWEGLRFVIVALPGLFSYLFFISVLPCVYNKYTKSDDVIKLQSRQQGGFEVFPPEQVCLWNRSPDDTAGPYPTTAIDTTTDENFSSKLNSVNFLTVVVQLLMWKYSCIRRKLQGPRLH